MTVFIVGMLLSCAGLFFSYYAYAIEQRVSVDKAYKPVCDISDRISCTKPFASEYSKIFGISNAVVGMAYYATLMLLFCGGYSSLISIALVGSLCATILFAYILYFKIHTICLICSCIYGINIALCCVWFCC